MILCSLFSACLSSNFAVIGCILFPWWTRLCNFSCPTGSILHQLLIETQRGLTAVPVLQELVHGSLIYDAQQLFLFFLWVWWCLLRNVHMCVAHEVVFVHVLKELLDANLGKTLSMFCTCLFKEFPLNVNVVGPIFALQKGRLGKAGTYGSGKESQQSY